MARVTAPEPTDNVVDLFSGKPLTALRGEQIIRLSPEYDGLSMLYSNRHTDPNKLYAMKILCWGLQADGEVVGMVPWLNGLMRCADLDDAATGLWEGYYDPSIDQVFYDAPPHKIAELEHAAAYFGADPDNPNRIVQEIPDTIGTHAMLTGEDDDTLVSNRSAELAPAQRRQNRGDADRRKHGGIDAGAAGRCMPLHREQRSTLSLFLSASHRQSN